MNTKKKKIVIALSGGIDSAFSAYLVKKQFPKSEITAVFMQNWDDFLAGNQVIKLKCSQSKDWEDARKVAEFLNIDLEKRQFIREYWEEVFTDFLTGIRSGVTPNPDVLCNGLIKFFHFVNYVKKELKADCLVTGHYARILHDKKRDIYYLGKSKDENKDQTYFLCQIDRSVLSFLNFPLGEFEKQEVKKQTSRLKFPNIQRKESMGICFIGENNFESFISNYLPGEAGDFIDIETGLTVGRHRGIPFYTIGQRRGLALSGERIPYYVIGKNPGKKIIYVAKGNDNQFLYSSWCSVKKVNWLIPQDEVGSLESDKGLTAKFRHRQKEIAIEISFEEKVFHTLKVLCKVPMRALTPGQYAVFYKKDICLGGGVIFHTEKLSEQVLLF